MTTLVASTTAKSIMMIFLQLITWQMLGAWHHGCWGCCMVMMLLASLSPLLLHCQCHPHFWHIAIAVHCHPHHHCLQPFPSTVTILLTVDHCYLVNHHYLIDHQSSPLPSPTYAISVTASWLFHYCFFTFLELVVCSVVFSIIVHSSLSWLVVAASAVVLHHAAVWQKLLLSNEHDSLCRCHTMSTCRTLYPTKVDMISINTFVVLMGMPRYIKMICVILNL